MKEIKIPESLLNQIRLSTAHKKVKCRTESKHVTNPLSAYYASKDLSKLVNAEWHKIWVYRRHESSQKVKRQQQAITYRRLLPAELEAKIKLIQLP
jgi:hypothetical protein